MNIEINSIAIMKKMHPCQKSNELKILRFGIDVKTKCLGCDSIVIISRNNFNKKIKSTKE